MDSIRTLPPQAQRILRWDDSAAVASLAIELARLRGHTDPAAELRDVSNLLLQASEALTRLEHAMLLDEVRAARNPFP